MSERDSVQVCLHRLTTGFETRLFFQSSPLAVLQESSKDPSLEASADKPNKVMHLNELLGHYLSPERLEGENQYHCDRCGKLQDGERTIGIIESPRYLILTLLRFAYDTKLQTRSKVTGSC